MPCLNTFDACVFELILGAPHIAVPLSALSGSTRRSPTIVPNLLG